MNDPSAILANFQPISLAELESVALLDRTDTKFVLRRSELPRLLGELSPHYRVLEIDGVRVAGYETRYFDTVDRRLYLRHHNDRLPRFKVRYRRYVDTDLMFLEVKVKTRTGRTHKERMRVPSIPDRIAGEELEFVAARVLLTTTVPAGIRLADQLEPSLQVAFRRLTFAHRHAAERLTLDLDLCFGAEPGNAGHRDHRVDAVIGELKQSAASRHSVAHAVFRELGIRPRGISKYCLGKVITEPGLKYNAFKPELLAIRKLAQP